MMTNHGCLASLADGELIACKPAADMEALGDVFGGLLSRDAPYLNNDAVETWSQDIQEFWSGLASYEPRSALQVRQHGADLFSSVDPIASRPSVCNSSKMS